MPQTHAKSEGSRRRLPDGPYPPLHRACLNLSKVDSPFLIVAQSQQKGCSELEERSLLYAALTKARKTAYLMSYGHADPDARRNHRERVRRSQPQDAGIRMIVSGATGRHGRLRGRDAAPRDVLQRAGTGGRRCG